MIHCRQNEINIEKERGECTNEHVSHPLLYILAVLGATAPSSALLTTMYNMGYQARVNEYTLRKKK